MRAMGRQYYVHPVFFLSLLVCGMLLLAGCSGGGFYSSKTPTKNDYRKGFGGIDMEFIPAAPPEEIPEDSLFSVGINLHNEGAFDVEDGIMVIDIDNDYIGLFGTPRRDFSLEGKSDLSPKGQGQDYFFEGTSKFLDTESSRRSVPVIASICYPYETVLEDTFCINKEGLSDSSVGEDVCEVRSHSYGGQGGPVGITSASVSVLNGEVDGTVIPVFDIYLKHSGNGLILESGNYRLACSASPGGNENLARVKIKEITLSGVPLSCNKDTVLLNEGKARVRCELSEHISAFQMPYEAPFRMVLEYAYKNTETKIIDLLDFS